MKCEDSELTFKMVVSSGAGSATVDGFQVIDSITLENSSGPIETIAYYNGVC